MSLQTKLLLLCNQNDVACNMQPNAVVCVCNVKQVCIIPFSAAVLVG